MSKYIISYIYLSLVLALVCCFIYYLFLQIKHYYELRRINELYDRTAAERTLRFC